MMMRNAFSMITAIFVMLLMATVAAFVLNLSGKMVQETGTLYRQEQAALLARSYTELAVMAVMNHDRNATSTCVEDINGVVNGLRPDGAVTGSSTGGSGYNVMTRIYYIGNDLPCSNTRKLTHNGNHSTTAIVSDYKDASPASPDELAAIIVDVYVQYKNPDAPTHWITFHRRTLQKI
jgi:type II secretory pathway pseudopilin PulG